MCHSQLCCTFALLLVEMDGTDLLASVCVRALILLLLHSVLAGMATMGVAERLVDEIMIVCLYINVDCTKTCT